MTSCLTTPILKHPDCNTDFPPGPWPVFNKLLSRYPALDGQWFIACPSRTLSKKKPLSRLLMGLPLVLFRDESGQASTLLDRCPHRNAPLSLGKVIAGNLECPYHGWQFGGDGACREIPGRLQNNKLGLEPNSTQDKDKPDDIPRSTGSEVSRAYSAHDFETCEQDGFIWIKLPCRQTETDETNSTSPNLAGKDNTPERLPYLHQKSYVHFIWETTIEADLLNALENFLDGTHTHFIHAGLIRSNQNRAIVTARIRPQANGVEVEYHEDAPQNGFIARLFDRNRQTSYGRFRLPSIAQLEYRTAEKVKNVKAPHALQSTHAATHTRLLLTVFLTPVDEKRLTAHIVTTYHRTFLPGWLTHLLIKPLFWLALKQDQRILKKQQDNIIRCSGEAFHSTEMDVMRAPIRQLLTRTQPKNHNERTVQFRL